MSVIKSPAMRPMSMGAEPTIPSNPWLTQIDVVDKGVAKTIFASLGISLMFYVGGMAIGWVLRGFFRKQA